MVGNIITSQAGHDGAKHATWLIVRLPWRNLATATNPARAVSCTCHALPIGPNAERVLVIVHAHTGLSRDNTGSSRPAYDG